MEFIINTHADVQEEHAKRVYQDAAARIVEDARSLFDTLGNTLREIDHMNEAGKATIDNAAFVHQVDYLFDQLEQVGWTTRTWPSDRETFKAKTVMIKNLRNLAETARAGEVARAAVHESERVFGPILGWK